MHPQDTSDAFALARAHVHDGHAIGEFPRIDSAKRQTTDKRIHHNLKGKSRKGLIVIRAAQNLHFSIIRIQPHHRGQIKGTGQVINDRIQQRLNSLILKRRTAKNGNHLLCHCRLTNGGLEHGILDRSIVKKQSHNVVIKISDSLNEDIPGNFRLFNKLRGNIYFFIILPQFIIINNGFEIDDINHTHKTIFNANRKLNRHGIRAQSILHLRNNACKIRSHTIHFINERNARDVVLISLSPDRFGLRLHASDSTKNRYSSIQHAHRTLYLNGKIHVSGRINYINKTIMPKTGRCSRRDRNASLTLLFHPVHGCGTFVRLTYLVFSPCVK